MAKRTTKEEFISKAMNVHGDKFNYNKVEYITSKLKVIIICPEHGEFSTTPSIHLRSGCKKCESSNTNKKKSKSPHEFIKEAVAVHGDRYDYSKTEYKNKRTNIIITCKVHGDFFQDPNNHLKSTGCFKCGRIAAGVKKKGSKTKQFVVNTESFINKAKIIHNDFYTYANSIYTKSENQILVTCPIHGDFSQKAHNHLTGFGCSECKRNKLSEIFRCGKENFIRNSKQVHGELYDYSLVKYKKAGDKVDLICKRHGVFQAFPLHHIRGVKCAECHMEIKTQSRESFVEKSIAIHGDRYDYSAVIYKNNNTKVCIICPDHGVFEQLPRSHSTETSSGCLECNKIDFWSPKQLTEHQKNAPNGTYIISLSNPSTDEFFIKIGISNNLNRRCAEIKRESAYEIEQLTYLKSTTVKAWELEQELHMTFCEYQQRPEINFSGATECFNVSIIGGLVKNGLLEEAELPENLLNHV